MTHVRDNAAIGVIFAIAGLSIAGSEGVAKPLDKVACAALVQDIENFKRADVGKLMENGPVWAQAHLSSSDLDTVRRYLAADAQLKFRCTPPGQLVTLKAPVPDDDDVPAPKKTEAASAEPKPSTEGGDNTRAVEPPSAGPAADVERKPPKPRRAAAEAAKKAPSSQAKFPASARTVPQDR